MDDARDALRRILRVDGPDVDDPAAASQFSDVVGPARRDAAGADDVGGGRDGDEDAALWLLHSLHVGACLCFESSLSVVLFGWFRAIACSFWAVAANLMAVQVRIEVETERWRNSDAACAR